MCATHDGVSACATNDGVSVCAAVASAEPHDTTSITLALRTLGSFDFEGNVMRHCVVEPLVSVSCVRCVCCCVLCDLFVYCVSLFVYCVSLFVYCDLFVYCVSVCVLCDLFVYCASLFVYCVICLFTV